MLTCLPLLCNTDPPLCVNTCHPHTGELPRGSGGSEVAGDGLEGDELDVLRRRCPTPHPASHPRPPTRCAKSTGKSRRVTACRFTNSSGKSSVVTCSLLLQRSWGDWKGDCGWQGYDPGGVSETVGCANFRFSASQPVRGGITAHHHLPPGTGLRPQLLRLFQAGATTNWWLSWPSTDS